MRRGEWAKAAPVSGIECVGLVKSCPGRVSGRRESGGTDGGLGRAINGSYADIRVRSQTPR
jgi:NADPH:quinone reductase